jgi:hypothetical protein
MACWSSTSPAARPANSWSTAAACPFAQLDDIDARWIEHYFAWQRDAAGREQLLPRPGVRRLPWRGRLVEPSSGEFEYRVERARPAFVDELRRIVLALPGAALAPSWLDPKRGIDGHTVRIGECVLALSVPRAGVPDDDYDGHAGVFAPGHQPTARAACNELVHRIAAATDAELASGRHDALIVLE